MSKERGVEIQTRKGDLPKEILNGLDKTRPYPPGRTFFWGEGERPKTIVCFSLNIPDTVIFALVCPAGLVEDLQVLRSENGDLVVEHERGEAISLGSPERGGITFGTGGRFHVVNLDGVRIGLDYPYIEARGLLADPLGESAGTPVVLVGLNYRHLIGFTLYKIVDVSIDRLGPTRAGDTLARFCGSLVEE